MIVVWWGTNVRKHFVGVSTDYCVICRDIRGLRLLDVASAGHVMGIESGPEQYVGRLRMCDSCGAEWLYVGAAVPQPRELPPEAREQLKQERLLVEERTRTRQTSPAERGQLIREPFQLMNIAVASRGRELKMDRATKLALAATVAVPFVIGLGGCMTKGDTKNWSMELTFAFFLPPIVLALFTAIIAAGEPKRFACEKVLPKVVDALRSLDPSPLELKRTLEDLRAKGFVLADYLSASDVSAALRG